MKKSKANISTIHRFSTNALRNPNFGRLDPQVEGVNELKHHLLLKGTIIKTVLASLEAIALIGILIYSFLAAGEGVWGYWGSILAIISMLSPIYIYAIPNTIFTIHNLLLVTKNRHTPESIQKYHKLSERYLIWGMITGGLYGCLLVPIFLLENIFLFIGYRKELASIKNSQEYYLG